MPGTERPTFFDPRTALRDLIERLRPLNGSRSFPSADWKNVLAQVEADDCRRHVDQCNSQIPPHAVVIVDFRLVGTRPTLTVLNTGFHLVADHERNAVAVRAYHLRDEARIRHNNREAVRRYQETNRDRINAARRAKRAAAKVDDTGQRISA